MIPVGAIAARRRGGGVTNTVGSFDFDGTNDYIELGSTPVTAVPLTICVWAKPDNANRTEALASVDSGATSRIQLDMRNGSNVGVASVNSGGTSAVSEGGDHDTTWEHCAGVCASTTSRTSYLNGVANTTNTSSNTPSGLSLIEIGARFSGGTRGAFFAGKLAHVAIWNIALSGAEIATLASGANPQSVQNANLVFYAPLTDGVAEDIITSTSLTVSGAVADLADYPTVAAYP